MSCSNNLQTNEACDGNELATNVTRKPLEYTPMVGLGMIILSTVLIIPYTPCVIVLWRKPLIEMSCYKIMAAMAIADFANLIIAGYWEGSLNIWGPHYTENYWLSAMAGAISVYFWTSYCCLTIVLAVNRIVALRSEPSATRWFGGNKAWLWVAACYLPGVTQFAIIVSPYGALVHDATLGLAIFDPLPQHKEWNIAAQMITAWNWVMAIVLPLLYIIVYVELRKKMNLSDNQANFGNKERRVVYQVTLICFFTSVAATTYVTFPYIITNAYLWCIANFIWQWAQGVNGLIYLGLNVTVRQEVNKLLGIKMTTQVNTIQVMSLQPMSAVSVHMNKTVA